MSNMRIIGGMSLLLFALSGAASAFRAQAYRTSDVCSRDSEVYNNEFYGRDIVSNDMDMDYADYYGRSRRNLFDSRDLGELDLWSRDPGLYQNEFVLRLGRGIDNVEYALDGIRSPEFKTVAYVLFWLYTRFSI